MNRGRENRTSNTPVGLLLLALFSVLASTAMAAENVRLQSTPRSFQVVPGEPIRLLLTVRADSALSFNLNVPNAPILKMRAIEKLPVRRTREGVVVYRRVLVWQGLEPGKVKLKNLSITTKGQKLLFPEINITVRDPHP